MNNETRDPLARWWWPGQWLHIVYGVWIDQLWYWKNVRPLLRDRNLRLKICVQSMLGMMLVALFFPAILGGILVVGRAQVDLSVFVQGAVLGMLSVVLSIVILAAILAFGKDIDRAVVYSIIMSTLVIAYSNIMRSIFPNEWMRVGWDVIDLAIWDAVMCMVLSLSVNVAATVIQSKPRSIMDAVIFGLLMSTSVRTANDIKSFKDFFAALVMLATISALGWSVGRYLGGHWAARQVPNAELRKHLANPDA